MRTHSRWYVDVKLGGRKKVLINGELFIWNPVYRTYNSKEQNELLRWSDLGIA
mgnify:CR=1 FL=1